MHARPFLLGLLTLIGLALWLGVGREGETPAVARSPTQPRYELDPRLAERDGTLALTPELQRKTVRFAPEVQPLDRQAVLTAIGSGHAEARRLVGLIDGLVTVRVGAIGGQAVGVATERETGYDVTLDLGRVSARFGQRGIDDVVLHELAHVLDFALVPDALDAAIDARTPRGYGCDDGRGACAPREERFADSFAKWATGDIGVDLSLGYRVPPPSQAWG